jgi:hypothetical protein
MRHFLVLAALAAPLLVSAGCGSSERGPCEGGCSFDHDFGRRMVQSGEEVDGLCQSWTLGNETELWVNTVTFANDGAYHHSNWFFVPEGTYDVADGAWNCDDEGFQELVAAALGGVLFAQSTQASDETQQFGPGVAVRIPPHSVVVGSTHLLNAGDSVIDTGLRMQIQAIDPADLQVKLTPFRMSYFDLHLAPMATSRFSMTCDVKTEHEAVMMEPFSMKLHYVLPHYHALGSSFFVALSGGTRDGEVLHEIGAFDAEAHGKTFFPPVDVSGSGATGFTFGCGFDNPRTVEVGWGIGDQEMCVILGFAETTMAFDGSMNFGNNTIVGMDGNVILNSGPCQVIGFPFYQDK